MARIRAITGERRAELGHGWRMALAPDGDRPADDATWIDAPVPGTAAEALDRAGMATPELLASLQSRHIWYRSPVTWQGRRTLRFEGLAPHCDIYLGERLLHRARSMFDPVEIAVDSDGTHGLFLHFMPLTAETAPASAKRQRWRPHLIASPHMRNARASLIGHMPGWCPPVQPVGPYRRIEIIGDGPVTAKNARVRCWLEGAVGHIEISIEINGSDGPFAAACWDADAPLQRGEDGLWRAHLTIEKPPLWWPHTHGDPHLLPLKIHGPPLDNDDEGIEIDLGPIGFRTLELDRGPDGDGFGLVCNGVPIFCRGVNWTPHDTRALGGEDSDYRLPLIKIISAGMNMIRVSGILTREAPAFFDICDRFGILVWHDEPFANFDYDFDFLQNEYDIGGSLTRYLAAVETSPALAVVCGGSEMAQQGAMLSLPESVWSSRWCTETLPALVRAVRPDVIAVPNSPWGGELPFQVDKGVAHYYGVGAYMRPLEDARRANVRFASECLAFANLPQPERFLVNSGGALPGSAEWRARVVRDLKADWDFEDVRDHYLGLLYGVDPQALKREDPARYISLSTAVSGEVMQATFAEWRRVGSVTRGGLVWFWQDAAPGFGWGVVDAGGVPKPAFYALRRAFRTVTVALTDEGVNGLHCHVINENLDDQAGVCATDFRLTLTCFGDDGSIVIDGTKEFSLPKGQSLKLTSAEVFGIFFDVTYAYRFGPPAHKVSVARLTDGPTGEMLAEAFHFPQGRGSAVGETGLASKLEQVEIGGTKFWALHLTTQRLAQSVHIAAEGHLPRDDWFHLAPGEGRRILLGRKGRPSGVVTALNGVERIGF